MAKYTNTAPGARGIRMKDGSTVYVDAGAVLDVDGDVEDIHPDIVKGDKPDAVQRQADDASTIAELRVENDDLRAEIADLTAKLASLDGDGDGKPGGSQAQTPPALTGKSKGELLDIAKAEGVDATDEMTIPQITDAIKAKRAA